MNASKVSNEVLGDVDAWIDQLDFSHGCAIAIESPCAVCQPRIGLALTEYLRGVCGEPWLLLNDHKFEQLHANTSFRNVIDSDQWADLEGAMQAIATRGNVVLEMTHAQRATLSASNVFQVSLSCKEPEDGRHHLWLNGKREPPETLIARVADHFMAWSGDR